MRRAWVLFWFAVVLLPASAGCTKPSQPPPATVPHLTTAPRDPDFRPVIERFYQLVEGAHWVPAYGMLSGRLRGVMSRSALEQRYRDFASADVNARQTGPRSAEVRLTVPARSDPRARTVVEILRFAWDGEAWLIDDITPRSP